MFLPCIASFTSVGIPEARLPESVRGLSLKFLYLVQIELRALSPDKLDEFALDAAEFR